MSDWIQVKARAEVAKVTGGERSPASKDELGKIGRQMAADAVFGTFGEFSGDYWKGKVSKKLEEFTEVEVEKAEDRWAEITLRIDSSQYDPERGGLQHFLGVLAGDLFFLQIPGFVISQLKVTDVSLPKKFSDGLELHYRSEAYTTERIRNGFQLEAREPLMAFSIKPRVGLSPQALREIVLGVLEAGFQIAEFDTRYLDLSNSNVEFLVRLAREAAAIGGDKRVTRLSPNLSVPQMLAVDIYKQFLATSKWPRVVKVDGGLDGLGTVQALRKIFAKTDSPIVTCYPLLSEQLSSKVPRNFFVHSLALSGVDIIYPGGSPRVGGGARDLGAEERTAVNSATARYHKLAAEPWPMITLAGGIYAGQLHCLYELVGPPVAYFLGGCVSLHKDGPIGGAKLCIDIIREAAKLHEREPKEIKDLPEGLITRAESAYNLPPGASPAIYRYTSPKERLSQLEVPRW